GVISMISLSKPSALSAGAATEGGARSEVRPIRPKPKTSANAVRKRLRLMGWSTVLLPDALGDAHWGIPIAGAVRPAKPKRHLLLLRPGRSQWSIRPRGRAIESGVRPYGSGVSRKKTSNRWCPGAERSGNRCPFLPQFPARRPERPSPCLPDGP